MSSTNTPFFIMRTSNKAAKAPIIQQKADGYIVIIVLLLTSVLLMLGLSLATRTTEEVALSGQEGDTTRVFNAAETGIEEALYQIGLNPGMVTNVEAPVSGLNNVVRGENSLVTVTASRNADFEMLVKQGEVITLGWKDDTKIYWKHTDCTSASSLIVTLYTPGSPATAYHAAFNPIDSSGNACSQGSNFDTAQQAAGIGSLVKVTNATFGISAATDLTGSMIRIRPLYADANLQIKDSSAIDLLSTARDQNVGSGTEGTETRKIKVVRTDPAPPGIFDYAVFSGTSLSK